MPPIRTCAAAVGLAAMTATLFASAAEAAPRNRYVQVQGADGRGYVASRNARRTSSSFTANRSIQTNGGYGLNRNRSAAYGEGSYSGASQTVFNSGRSINRSASVHDNGDGTASYQRTVTGSEGRSRSVSGSVPYAPPQ